MNRSVLEYIFDAHQAECRQASHFIALLLHCYLLSKEAKLKDSGTSKLPSNWISNLGNGDVRIEYEVPPPNGGAKVHLVLTVVQRGNNVFITVTNISASVGENTAQVDVDGAQFVNMEAPRNVGNTFQRLEDLEDLLQKRIWTVLFPARSSATSNSSTWPDYGSGLRDPPHGRDPLRVDPYDYGRSDLDPFANLGHNPFGMRGGPPDGGMLLDPRRGRDPRIPFDPSSGLPEPLPPGAIPPGARFDPFGPPGLGPRSGGRPRGPDPDFPPPHPRFGGGGGFGGFI